MSSLRKQKQNEKQEQKQNTDRTQCIFFVKTSVSMLLVEQPGSKIRYNTSFEDNFVAPASKLPAPLIKKPKGLPSQAT